MRDDFEAWLRDLGRRAGFADADPRAVAAATLLLAAVTVWAVWAWWPRGEVSVADQSASTAVATASQSATVAAAPSAEASSQPLWVHVAGEVRHPGVVRVEAGSRVAEAVDAAGGMLGSADADSVNLARVVQDGEQITVPKQGEDAATASGGPGTDSVQSAAPGGAVAPVNINTADVAALDSLPGVGPATAQRIIQDREANGPFASPEDLGRVSGIGPKKLDALAGLIAAP